ncbi:MAG: hypothetical protein HOP29_02200 [Phycisphaerales bacterium]|nr:hypothetical protein [Phycisphaerales bacterium]
MIVHESARGPLAGAVAGECELLNHQSIDRSRRGQPAAESKRDNTLRLIVTALVSAIADGRVQHASLYARSAARLARRGVR